MVIAPPRFCPYCGEQSVGTAQDTDQDFWEAMARDFELPIITLKKVYDMWTQVATPYKYQHFAVFVNELKEGQRKRAAEQQQQAADSSLR